MLKNTCNATSDFKDRMSMGYCAGIAIVCPIGTIGIDPNTSNSC